MLKKTIAAVTAAGLALLGAGLGASSAQALPTTTTWTDAGLQEMFKVKGHLTWSTDGLGIASGHTGTIQADRPAGSTVIAAFLMVSTMNIGGLITHAPTDIKLNNKAVTFTHRAKETTSGMGFDNFLADVTDNVKAKLDAHSAGVVDINVDNGQYQETGDSFITGDELLVVYDTPSAPKASIILEFGTSATTGDNFALDYPALTSPQTADLEMSIGDAYSYGEDQHSTITVNGQTLTDRAGHFDDCSTFAQDNTDCPDPALITVGGVGDSTDNPNLSDPWSETADDELYSLSPFVHVGDTQVAVTTLNESNNDNIFSAVFYLKNVEVTGAKSPSSMRSASLANTGGNGSDLAILGSFGFALLAGGLFLMRKASVKK